MTCARCPNDVQPYVGYALSMAWRTIGEEGVGGLFFVFLFCAGFVFFFVLVISVFPNPLIHSAMLTEPAKPIFECFDDCICDQWACPTRVVSRGVCVPLEIFFTGPARGWGLRAQNSVPPWGFVIE